MSDENMVQDLLNDLTDVLLSEQDSRQLNRLLRHYDEDSDQHRLLHLIQQIHRTLIWQEPSDKFTRRLKQDLMGTQESGVLARLRYLPARVQVAAGVAVVAGFMLITRRRLTEPSDDTADVAVLQQQ